MNSTPQHILLLCNPTEGQEKAQRMTELLCLLLEERAISAKAFYTGWPSSLEGYSQVWVIGGDGTINWFVNAYPDNTLPIAVFAGGSGNDLHWMLYGDISPEQQVDRILGAVPRAIDGGWCNGRLFLNGLGIGFDGAIVRDLIGKRKLAGKASYLLSIMKHVISYMERKCHFEMNEETVQQDCFMISVANGRRYGGGFLVAPKAVVDDALLDICIIGRISPFNRMRYLPVMERGAHLSLPITTYRQTGEVVITAAEALPAHLDGEFLSSDRFEVRILPERFSFLC